MSRPSSGILKKPDSPPQLVVSFHDLHPGSKSVCAGFLARLTDLGVLRTSLLVVPRWHQGPPVTADAHFVAWLRELAAAGHDICLHGLYHRAEKVSGGPVQQLIGRCYTTGEGEFFQIDRATAAQRIQEGLRLLTNEAGLPVSGFTPPAWLLSPAGRAALVEAGLDYNTMHGHVEFLRTGETIAAPTLVYSCRSAWRRAVSLVWVVFWARLNRAAPVLRIAAHPGDFANPRLESSLYRQVQAALARGRSATTYRDLVPAISHPLAAASVTT